MKNSIKIGLLATVLLGTTTFSSCKKYRKYDDGEVVENTFTGNVDVGSTGADPGGDFTGNGDSGTYSFVWENSSKKANVNCDITSNSGSVQMIINDAKGNEVLNKTLTAGSGEDSFSSVTEEGKSGKWLVTIELSNFNGDGSYSISPGN
jgi:hypothetical protein